MSDPATAAVTVPGTVAHLWAGWLLPGIIVACGLAAGWIADRIAMARLRAMAARTQGSWDDIVFGALRGVALVWCLLVSVMIALRNAPIDAANRELVGNALTVAWIASFSLVLARLTGATVRHLMDRNGLHGTATIAAGGAALPPPVQELAQHPREPRRALVAAGRSGLGDEVFAQATLSRYAAFSIPGVVAVYGLCASLALNARSRAGTALLGIVFVAVVACAAHAYPRGIEAGRATEDSRRQAARILISHKTEPPAAFTIFGHDPRRVQRYARFLDKHDHGPFAEELPPSTEHKEGPETQSRPLPKTPKPSAADQRSQKPTANS